MKLTAFIIVLLISLSSCSIFYHEQKPDKEFLRILNKDSVQSDNLLRYDGIFRFILTDSSSEKIISDYKYHKTDILDPILNPIVFFNNGRILYGKALFGGIYGVKESNVYHWVSNNNSKKQARRSWGVYEVKDSIIKAIIYVPFTSSVNFTKANWYLCYFEGKIKSEDYISDWHMVPPYPKLSRIEKGTIEHLDYLEYEKTQKYFSFKYFPAKTTADSTNVWINKYIKE